MNGYNYSYKITDPDNCHEDVSCEKCGRKKFIIYEYEYDSSAGRRLRIECDSCGKFLMYAGRNKPNKPIDILEVIYWGKYNGQNKTYSDLVYLDLNYVNWCVRNLTGRIKDTFLQAIEEKEAALP
jgi:hypothetical protein